MKGPCHIEVMMKKKKDFFFFLGLVLFLCKMSCINVDMMREERSVLTVAVTDDESVMALFLELCKSNFGSFFGVFYHYGNERSHY